MDFYATNSETYAICDCGQVWLVQSEGLMAPMMVSEIPACAEGIDAILCHDLEVNCCEVR